MKHVILYYCWGHSEEYVIVSHRLLKARSTKMALLLTFINGKTKGIETYVKLVIFGECCHEKCA